MIPFQIFNILFMFKRTLLKSIFCFYYSASFSHSFTLSTNVCILPSIYQVLWQALGT